MRERLVLLFLSLVLILAGCATGGDAEMQVAGEQSKASADTGGTSDQPLSVDPAVTRGVLENGLTYYIRQNSEPEDRAFLRLAVNAGSVLEDDDQLGLAHFLEHMAFNGTESYSGNEIISFLERLGMQFGPDINAYTSFDETVYQLDVPTDDEETFSTALNVLYEWAALMTLDPEEIDKERGVIVEEWRFRRGAQARMSEEQYPVLFGDSRYASRLPIGDMNIVRDFDPAVLRRYYEDWYRPELMSVIAVGDFDVAEVEAEISAVFSQIEPATDARERPVYEVPSHDETRFVVASDPETSYTTVSVIVKRDSQPLVSKDDYRELLQGQLFSAMFNTRLADISREPDAPFLDAGVSVGRLVRTEAAATIGAAVEGNNVTPAVGALLIETRRIIEHGFTETELDRAKRNALRGIEQAYRERNDISSRAFADEYVRAYLENEAIPGIPAERELYDELLPTIDLEDVNSLAETYLDDQNRVVMVSAIESEDLPEITESELEEAFRAAQLVEVAPYVDVEVAGEILQTVPVAGSIMESRPLEIDGAVEWRLSNGARIVLYPTDHRADEILFTAFSPGGTSTVPLDEHWNATYATTFTEQMGYGELSVSDLQRVLAGRALQVAPYISTYSEGVTGSTSVEDLETTLQLMHLKLTSPRRDVATFTALQNQFTAIVANQENQPNFLFSKRFQELYSDENPRAVPIDPAGVESLDLDTMLSVYEERFDDLSDFTFVFVGNIDARSFAPLAERYIASLPGPGSDGGWVDVGIDRPDEQVSDTVRAGIEPVAQVIVAYYGDYEFSQEANYHIRALERMLQIRMQEVIREDESGTYGVGVEAQFAQVPEERYGILLTFRADPERIDQLTGTAFDIIEEIKSELPDATYVERIRETQRAAFEEGLTSNEFWLNQIEYALEHDRPLDAIDQYLDLVNALTASDVRSAAQRYLQNDQYVQVTLLPGGQE